MASRLELYLIVAITSLGALPLLFKIDNVENIDKVIESKKSTELINFTQYDFNTTTINFKLTSKYGEEVADIWYLKTPKVVNLDIKQLTSKRAIVRKNSIIEFINSVELIKFDGKKYNSQRAFYNIKSRVLTTPDKFTIFNEYDMINGRNMEYDAAKKVTKAKKVRATFKVKSVDK